MSDAARGDVTCDRQNQAAANSQGSGFFRWGQPRRSGFEGSEPAGEILSEAKDLLHL